MKKISNLLSAMMLIPVFAACSDGDSFDPYKNQSNRPFYPSTVSFSSLNNEGAQTDKLWKFTYNPDNTIKEYTYENKVKTKNGVEVIEQHSGNLTYYTDHAGNGGILNKIVVTNELSEITTTEGYSDVITEDVKIVAGKVESIKTIAQRTYLNGTKEVFTTTRNFTYTDKFCTGCTVNDASGTVSYSYSWGPAQLNKVVVYTQGQNNNITHEEYRYTYNKRDLATDYGFNTLAFVYGNMPEIYAAMNLFGESSAYKLEGESYSGYRTINNQQYNISPVNRQFAILEATNSVTYTADSQNAVTYFFTFAN